MCGGCTQKEKSMMAKSTQEKNMALFNLPDASTLLLPSSEFTFQTRDLLEGDVCGPQQHSTAPQTTLSVNVICVSIFHGLSQVQ